MMENSEYVASEITIKNDVYARSLKTNSKPNKIIVFMKRKLTIIRECMVISKFRFKLIPKSIKNANSSSSRTVSYTHLTLPTKA